MTANSLLYLLRRKGQVMPLSGEDHWVDDRMPILDAEIGKSLDFRFL